MKHGGDDLNKALLEYEMKLKNIGINQMCERIGMSRSAFYRKCNGISEFTQGEMQKIIDVLGLTDPCAIFFSKEVS